MLRARIIPCLLIHNKGLVKTVNFSTPKYVGDPINAVRIFNEKHVDELMVVDIDATINKVPPDESVISKLAVECRMPLSYGGGIKTVEQAVNIIKLGVEKICISSAAIENPDLVTAIAEQIGSQSVVVVLDIKKSKKGVYEVWTHNGKINTGLNAIESAKLFEKKGCGEIVINSIDNDGVMKGYDLQLARQIRKVVTIPLTVLGGAGKINDIKELIKEFHIIGAAAGSLFVFKGVYKAVLINYPNIIEKASIYDSTSNA
jgi:cyclase